MKNLFVLKNFDVYMIRRTGLMISRLRRLRPGVKISGYLRFLQFKMGNTREICLLRAMQDGRNGTTAAESIRLPLCQATAAKRGTTVFRCISRTVTDIPAGRPRQLSIPAL